MQSRQYTHLSFQEREVLAIGLELNLSILMT